MEYQSPEALLVRGNCSCNPVKIRRWPECAEHEIQILQPVRGLEESLNDYDHIVNVRAGA